MQRPARTDERLSDPAPMETIAAVLLARREELAEEMMGRIREQVTEFGDLGGAELWESVRVSCLANIDTGLQALAADRALPREIPGEARELARLTARMDIPLAALLRAYRVGHEMMWQAWFDVVEQEGGDAGDRREAHREVSSFLFAYIDRLAGLLAAEHTAERDRFMRSREQRRTQLVRDLLDGAEPDPAVAAGVLGYDLRSHHLGLVVTGAEGERAVRELAQALDAPHRLVISLAGDTAWAWLGRARPFELAERLPVGGGAIVSAGDPGPGTEGFRRSHRQARNAHAVAVRARAEGRVVRYDEVALESLLAGDEERAREFVERELRGIDGVDARSQRLRETLRAYFATGQNASSAAALLSVHEHTVSYRLRTIEDSLGRSVNTRRAELEMALRLHELRAS